MVDGQRTQARPESADQNDRSHWLEVGSVVLDETGTVIVEDWVGTEAVDPLDVAQVVERGHAVGLGHVGALGHHREGEDRAVGIELDVAEVARVHLRRRVGIVGAPLVHRELRRLPLQS